MKTARTQYPDLPPLVVSTARLSTAGWVSTFLTRHGRPIRVLDAPTCPEDRGVNIYVATPSLFVRMMVPLASKPGPQEARGMPGGLFDPTPMKALDGLGGVDAECYLTRKKNGLHIESPAMNPIVLPAMEARFPNPPACGKARVATEPMSPDELRRAVVNAGRDGGGKDGFPESALAAMAVLDRVAPDVIAVTRFENHVMFNTTAHGLNVEIILAYRPAVRQP